MASFPSQAGTAENRDLGTARHWLIRAATLALAVTATSATSLACSVPKEMTRLSVPLVKFAAAVHDKVPLTIIALGSSSTAGAGASNPMKSYPARLQIELSSIWPNEKIQVINAGVGGQLANDMVARLDKDVLSKKPQLVIWQTGVNDAVRGVPIDAFKRTLAAGIERVVKAGSDIVLIDQQYYPKYEKLKNGPLYLTAIREVAQQYRVPVVQRYRIMKHLLDSRQFTTLTMLSPDQFHLNDTSYSCLGKLLAESLRGAATTTTVEPMLEGKRL
jgi:lysophospholipase L1-like esterase